MVPLTEQQVDVVRQVLIYHPRMDSRCCRCGWGVLGASHPEHIIDVIQQTVAEA